MSKRIRRAMRHNLSRKPMRGDEIFLFDPIARDYVNSIVNAVADGKLLVVAPGYSGSHLVAVDAKARGSQWWWPHEIRVEKSTALSDSQHEMIIGEILEEHVQSPDGSVEP